MQFNSNVPMLVPKLRQCAIVMEAVNDTGNREWSIWHFP